MGGKRINKSKDFYLTITQQLVAGVHYSKIAKDLEVSIGAIYGGINELLNGEVLVSSNGHSHRLLYSLGTVSFTVWWNDIQLNGRPKPPVTKVTYVPELFAKEQPVEVPVIAPKIKTVVLDTIYEINGSKHVLIGDKLIKI
jgi:hypothetical protein